MPSKLNDIDLILLEGENNNLKRKFVSLPRRFIKQKMIKQINTDNILLEGEDPATHYKFNNLPKRLIKKHMIKF